jgi:RNA polymerase sigma factor (TIGR02999 family)
MSEPAALLDVDDLRSEDDVRRSRVFNRIYEELRAIARRYVRGDRAGAAFQPTELVNEACLRLLPTAEADRLTQRRFLGFAARAMRQVLADHARREGAEKRGGGLKRVTLSDVADAVGSERKVRLEALDAALTRLEAVDPRLAEMIELHYFAGLTGDDLAERYGVSRRTLVRELALARAALLAEIDRFEADHP